MGQLPSDSHRRDRSGNRREIFVGPKTNGQCGAMWFEKNGGNFSKPKDPDPSKLAILRTYTPLPNRGSFTLPLEGLS